MNRSVRFVISLISGLLIGLLVIITNATAGSMPNRYQQLFQETGPGANERALAALTSMAEKGDIIANWTLVNLYIFGSPQHRNVKKGIESLERLSAKNDANSKEVLGDLYYYGKLVPQDYKKAAEWYADYVKYERDPDILTRYGLLFAMGKGVTQDKRKAYHLLKEAVTKGYIPAFLLAKKVRQSMSPIDRFFVQ